MHRLVSVGRVLFGLSLIGLAITHFAFGEFTTGRAPPWPASVPAGWAWAWLTGLGFLATGLVLLVGKRPPSGANPLARFASRETELVTVARVLVGPTLILNGIQHFVFVEFVASLIPAWLLLRGAARPGSGSAGGEFGFGGGELTMPVSGDETLLDYHRGPVGAVASTARNPRHRRRTPMKIRTVPPVTVCIVSLLLSGAGPVPLSGAGFPLLSGAGPALAVGVGVESGVGGAGPQETTAEGTFDVEARQVDEESFADGTGLGRYSLAKQYHGDLEGTGTGEMLTAATPIETSGAYVAMERFDGTLDGRRGTFILQHLGRMTQAGQSLTINVVPDSGTGDLEGLEGKLLVEITDGEHFYHFEYTLPDRR